MASKTITDEVAQLLMHVGLDTDHATNEEIEIAEYLLQLYPFQSAVTEMKRELGI